MLLARPCAAQLRCWTSSGCEGSRYSNEMLLLARPLGAAQRCSDDAHGSTNASYSEKLRCCTPWFLTSATPCRRHHPTATAT